MCPSAMITTVALFMADVYCILDCNRRLVLRTNTTESNMFISFHIRPAYWHCNAYQHSADVLIDQKLVGLDKY